MAGQGTCKKLLEKNYDCSDIPENKRQPKGIETWTLMELNSKNNIWLKSISWKW